MEGEGTPGGAAAQNALRRRWWMTGAVAALVLAGGHQAWSVFAGAQQALGWLAWAGAGSAYVLWVLWRGLAEHRRPDGRLHDSLGAGNAASVARGLAAAWLLGLLGLSLSAAELRWIPSLTCLAVALLDILDGRLARGMGLPTGLGSKLDVEYDGLGNLAAYASAARLGQLPAAFVLLGALRYLFEMGGFLRRRAGKVILPLAPSLGRKVIAALQWGFLVGVLMPIVSPPVTTIAGGVLGLALLASFGRDWAVVSGWVDADSAAYRDAERKARRIFLEALPQDLRLGLAVAAGWTALRAGTQMLALDSGAGTVTATAGLAVAAGLAVPAFALGAAARSAACLLLLAQAVSISTAGSTPLSAMVVTGCSALILLGSGRGSLWTPEDRIFQAGGIGRDSAPDPPRGRSAGT